jgi:UPF0755 protein
VSENGSTWPPARPWSGDPQDPRMFRRPRQIQPPRELQARTEPPLPPGYEPVHHDPRDRDPRRAGDSPWRRSPRRSRPEAAGWHPAGPAPASYDADLRGGGAGSSDDPDPYLPHDDDGYEDQEESKTRFVPGFGDYDYDLHEDDYDDYDEDEDGDDRPRPSRRRDRRNRGDLDRTARPPGRSLPASPGRDPRSRRDGRGPRRRRFRWLAPLVALAVILVPVGIGGSYAYSFYMHRYHPADYSGPGTGRVVVHVPSGASASSLGPELVKLGVVASARAFVLAAEHSSNPSGLLPGFYGMRQHMKASLAYALLLNPKNLVQVTVTIPEGWRLSQVVAHLGATSGIPASDYEKVLKDPAKLNLPAYANGNPEGYLFPATYEVQPHETALGVMAAMVQRFDQEAAAVNLPAAARQVHLTEDQVIIMASLVEAEGGKISDYPKIARVIYNRLAQNIPLQLDSTVLYGLNTYGIIASDAQLNSNSPYNTYRHKGLTPGPIDSPGDAAIRAVLHPASGNWIYFVTVNPKTGETLFTDSEAQFEQYRAELEHNLGQG